MQRKRHGRVPMLTKPFLAARSPSKICNRTDDSDAVRRALTFNFLVFSLIRMPSSEFHCESAFPDRITINNTVLEGVSIPRDTVTG